MKSWIVQTLCFLAGFCFSVGVSPAIAQAEAVAKEAATETEDRHLVSAAIGISGASSGSQQLIASETAPATTVEEWVAQIEAPNGSDTPEAIAQITNVRVEATETGLQVVLETAEGSLEVPTTRAVGNALIADIPNAAIAQKFSQANPAEGIALVEVTGLPGNRVRVAITGTEAPPVAEVRSEEQQLVLGVAIGSAAEVGEEEAIQVVVTGEQAGYSPNSATTATRTATPLRDIPQSIQVVPEQVLRDQGITQLRDALENVSGVTRDGNFGGTGSGSFVIRGFTQEGNFRDGFRDNDFYSIAETANIDRIEVLRGPASVLFGQAQPGGIINLVTKQPLREPYYEFSFSGGSYEFYRPTLDLSGSITSDGSLRYRLNAVYQNSDSFRDFVNTERFFIAPVLAWDLSENTTLTLNFEYLHDDPLYDRGLTALSNGSLPLPIDRFLGYPSLDDYRVEVYRGGYNLEHRFSDDWQIRNALSIYSSQSSGSNVDLNGDLINDRLLPRELRDDNFVNENYALQTELTGRFDTGSIGHQVLLGVELNRRSSLYNAFSADLPPIDIFDPDYDVSRPTEFRNTYNQIIFTDTIGVYLQDQIDLFDRLKLLVGGRLDFVEQDETFPYAGTSNNQSSDAFSLRLGIVYQPSDEVSLYASYSRSFFPVIGRSADNSPFSPERGTQYEVGIKADFLKGALSATLAAYDIAKANVLTTDPNDTDFSIQVGEQRSRGVDFNIAGEILPGWNIIAGYAYTDARVTEDNSIPEGDFLQNVAENTANLWTTYEIQGGALRGLGFGLGLFFVGERQGDFLPNTNFQLPSYFRTDAALFYRRDRLAAALNIRNLFGTEYYETAQGRNIVYPGAPFTVQGTISYEF